MPGRTNVQKFWKCGTKWFLTNSKTDRVFLVESRLLGVHFLHLCPPQYRSFSPSLSFCLQSGWGCAPEEWFVFPNWIFDPPFWLPATNNPTKEIYFQSVVYFCETFWMSACPRFKKWKELSHVNKKIKGFSNILLMVKIRKQDSRCQWLRGTQWDSEILTGHYRRCSIMAHLRTKCGHASSWSTSEGTFLYSLCNKDTCYFQRIVCM